jgi:hypothetical protein
MVVRRSRSSGEGGGLILIERNGPNRRKAQIAVYKNEISGSEVDLSGVNLVARTRCVMDDIVAALGVEIVI